MEPSLLSASETFSSAPQWTPVSSSGHFAFPFPPAPGGHQPAFCPWIYSFGHFICLEPHDVRTFGSGFFYLACFCGLSILYRVLYSFLWLNNILLYKILKLFFFFELFETTRNFCQLPEMPEIWSQFPLINLFSIKNIKHKQTNGNDFSEEIDLRNDDLNKVRSFFKIAVHSEASICQRVLNISCAYVKWLLIRNLPQCFVYLFSPQEAALCNILGGMLS